jgi:hypothetical protein
MSRGRATHTHGGSMISSPSEVGTSLRPGDAIDFTTDAAQIYDASFALAAEFAPRDEAEWRQ